MPAKSTSKGSRATKTASKSKTKASANRVVIAVKGPIPGNEQLRSVATQLHPTVSEYGVRLRGYIRNMTRKPDWDTTARMLTDQYSPANLLRNR